MPIATVRGVRINYEIVGDDGPWVVLITGGRRGYREFVPLAQKIAQEGHRVMLHDRRNTGASDIHLEAKEVEEATWADDLRELLAQHDAVPAFIGGSSSGARTAIMFGLRHPDATRGLLLVRVTGGEFAASRLPENYYGQFIRIAREGGMKAICETEAWRERIEENPENRAKLMSMDADDFIATLSRWKELFEAGARLPVMGVTEDELNSLRMPAIVIPGNDNTHSSESGRIAHRMIAGSEIHELGIADVDVALIPFDEWKPYEPEIAAVLTDFMKRHA
ncbi:MAG: alpha/beta hydrolase [Rhodospirillaceae bacterium]